jgi:hypothetical protein
MESEQEAGGETTRMLFLAFINPGLGGAGAVVSTGS